MSIIRMISLRPWERGQIIDFFLYNFHIYFCVYMYALGHDGVSHV